MKYKEDIIPISDPMYSKITKILRKLANANRDVFRNTQWTISVVNAPSLTNAMVLPVSEILFYLHNWTNDSTADRRNSLP